MPKNHPVAHWLGVSFKAGGAECMISEPSPSPFQPKRSEEHTSELQSLRHLVCRLLLEKKCRSAGTVASRCRTTGTPAGEGRFATRTVGGSPRSSPTRAAFFFNDTAPTEIYTLSLHDALPIFIERRQHLAHNFARGNITFQPQHRRDRKSTRLNSSHLGISYAVFCLKKQK